MKKEVELYSDDEINGRLVFAAKLRGYSTDGKLTTWLEEEALQLQREQIRRVTGAMGDGI